MSEEVIFAIVKRVVSAGPHGPYAIAASDDILGSITFSLEGSVWKESRVPEPGVIVVLSDLMKKSAGWRAMKARMLQPSDESN